MGGSGSVETVGFDLSNGKRVEVEFRAGAGLGFVPWPGTFALANYLDKHAEELELSSKTALELGSGSSTISGLAAGHLCKFTTLTDRPEVIQKLGDAASRAGLLFDKVDVKVLDWGDLDFTMSCFRPENIDLIIMTDVVYYDMLWKPLLHTLLLLSRTTTMILWTNCNAYPKFKPDIDAFLKLIGEFFDVAIVDDIPQSGCGSPSEVLGGRAVTRRLTLRDEEEAREAVDQALSRDCARRCFV
mmetsp:Transcript_39218/g.104707  ORF Transcript_39218/g.104707 Transcript_39218/m.104707 type:complete len:243 (+) Transcript_39218:113-841(+)